MTARLLIVDDEAIIAFDLAERLEMAGFDVIGIATSLAQGLDLCAECDVAILDVNLGRGETSAPLAERLRLGGKQFVALTGYNIDQVPPIFSNAPIFSKPVALPPLVATLQSMSNGA